MKTQLKFLTLWLGFMLAPFFSCAQWQQYTNVSHGNGHCVGAYDSLFYYAGQDDFFLRTYNSGLSWDTLPIKDQFGSVLVATSFYDVHFTSATNGVAVGYTSFTNQEVIFQTTNGGLNWTPVNISTAGSVPRVSNAIFFTSSTDGYVVCTNGRILKTINGGSSWNLLSTSLTNEFKDVFFTSSGTGYVAGVSKILKTTNAGTTWSSQTFTGITFNAIHFPTASVGYAVGDNKTVYKTTNSGALWSAIPVNIPGAADFHSVYFTSNTTGYVVGDKDIYKTTSGGLYWEKADLNIQMRDVFFRSFNHGFAAGYNGSLLVTVNGGQTMVPVSSFAQVPAICHDSTFTFTNESDPSWTYQWLINGVVFSSAYNASYTFTNASNYDTISLVAFNGVYRDTFSRAVYVEADLNINLQVSCPNDSVCTGQSTTINVLASEPGVTYQLWNGINSIGASQPGNGGVLNFITGAVSVQTTFTVKATKTVSSCGTNVVSVNQVVYIGNADLTKTLSALSSFVCYNNSTFITLNNSEAGVIYKLKLGAAVIGTPQTGNGGNLSFNTGNLTDTTVFTVSASSVYGCTSNLLQTVTVNVEKAWIYFSLDNFNPESGQAVSVFNNSLNPFGSYQWTVGPSASPSSSNLAGIGPVTFASPGAAFVKLLATSPNGCKDSLIKNIQVISPFTPPSCQLIYTACNFVNSGASIKAITKDKMGNSFSFFNKEIGNSEIVYAGQNDSLKIIDAVSPTYPDGYTLVKFNQKGIAKWAVKLRDDNFSAKNGAAVCDSLGNVYVAYFHQHTYDSVRIYSADNRRISAYMPFNGSNYTSVLIVKYDSNGFYKWHNTMLEPYYDDFIHLKMDHSGNLFVSAYENAGRINTSSGAFDWVKQDFYGNFDIVPDETGGAFIAKRNALQFQHVDANGTLLYTSNPVNMIGNTVIETRDAAKDAHNNLYFTAVFYGQFVFNGDTISDPYISGPSHEDMIVCKMQQNGQQIWLKQLKSSSPVTCGGFAVDGNSVVAFCNAFDTVYLMNDTSVLFQKKGFFLLRTDTLGLTRDLVKVYEFPSFTAGTTVAFSNNLVVNDAAQSGEIAFNFTTNSVLPGGSTLNTYNDPNYSTHALYKFGYACMFKNLPDPNALVAYFVAPGTCAGSLLQLADQSLNNPTSWSWSMPGAVPSSSTLQNPSVFYANAGVYTVQLTVSDGVDTSTYSRTIHVNASPIVTVLSDTAVCANSYALASASGATTYQWSNGDLNSSVAILVGITDTALSVIGTVNGCTDTISLTIHAQVISGMSMSMLPDTVCNTDSVYTLQGTPAGGVFYDDWGLVTGGIFNSYQIGIDGIDVVHYSVTDAGIGCTQEVTDTVYVKVCSPLLPPVAAFSFPSFVCSGTAIQFTDQSLNNPTSWFWSVNGGVLFSFLQNPSFIFSNGGTYTIELTVSNANGTDGPYLQTIVVNQTPLISVDYFQDDTICDVGGMVPLPAGYPSGGTYTDAYGAINGSNFDPSIGPPGIRSVYYTYSDVNGCSATDSSLVFVQSCSGVEYQNSFYRVLTLEAGIKYSVLSAEKRIESVKLFSMQGQFLKEYLPGSNTCTVDLSDYSPGIFLTQVCNSDREIFIMKLIRK